jgi:cell division protein FtsZ
MMGSALASGPDRARIAAEQAVACPLLEGIDLSGAKGVLVLITAAKSSLKLSESKLAMNTIRAYASPDAHVIYGTAYDEGLGDEIRVTVVATGLSKPKALRVAHPIQVLRNGTDNIAYAPILDVDAGNQSVTGTLIGATNYDVPAYVRNLGRHPDRTSASAKVDALSSGGMGDIDIPAFLRKQAD